MDVFVVLAEWIDLGLGGLGIAGGLFIYRRRYLIRESLWWWGSQNRLRWLKIYLDALPAHTGGSAAVEELSRMLRQMGHPLNQAELEFAVNYQSGKMWHTMDCKSQWGVGEDARTRQKNPANPKPGTD